MIGVEVVTNCELDMLPGLKKRLVMCLPLLSPRARALLRSGFRKCIAKRQCGMQIKRKIVYCEVIAKCHNLIYTF